MTGKQAAAEKAIDYVEGGMTIGLGTGSTAAFAIEALGRKVREGLHIRAVASSLRSEEQARSEGITIVSFSDLQTIDVYIDGADEVDRDLNLLKGGGGALMREKILAFNSKAFFVLVDASKLVECLGAFPLPVEVTPFAIELTVANLAALGCRPRIRQDTNSYYLTDNGNFVVDCDFLKIDDVAGLMQRINAIPGVLENGLFQKDLVSTVIVGNEDGRVDVLDAKNVR